jgi:hypothetical protein
MNRSRHLFPSLAAALLSSQFDTHYEIDPRFPSDIVVRTP